jgi:folate-binding protein YgfZ
MAPVNPADGLLFDLSARVKLRVTGADRARFLNGQLTNDVRKATASNAIAACILNAKGKLDAHVFLSTEADAFMVDAEPELAPTLQPRVERYVIADDVELEDVGARWSILHVRSETRPVFSGKGPVLSANRFRGTGWDIWLEGEERDQVFEKLTSQFAFCDAGQAEVFRIERGVPRWERELTPDIIPVEADLAESCIDYEKGCYIGQEVISRMKMSGQRSKRLCGLVSAGEGALAAGMRLTTQSAEPKEVGWVTSATFSERLGRPIALGYVKRGWNSPGTQLAATRAGGVAIVDLPFI